MNKIPITFLLFCLFSCVEKNKEVSSDSTLESRVLQSSDIVWQKLNPARGDKSPQAGTI